MFLKNWKFRKCSNNQCVNIENVCDNERHCFDTSDENCMKENSIIDNYQYGIEKFN